MSTCRSRPFVAYLMSTYGPATRQLSAQWDFCDHADSRHICIVNEKSLKGARPLEHHLHGQQPRA